MIDLYTNVQIDLRNAHAYGIPWSEMARDSGLCAATVKRFANNDTSRPSFRTVLWLAEYAGHKVSIARQRNAEIQLQGLDFEGYDDD